MDQYEIIGIDQENPPASDDGLQIAAPASPTRPWLVVVPVVAVVALVVGLTRGGPAAVDEAASAVPTTVRPDDASAASVVNNGPPTSPTTEPNNDAELIASFADQLVLTGRPNVEMTVRPVGSDEEVPIGITGRPLYFLDGWLFFEDTNATMVVDLRDPSSLPIELSPVASDNTSYFYEPVSVNATTVFVHRPLSDSEGDWVVDAYAIGSWAAPVRSEATGSYGLTSIGTQPGSGVFELMADGYRRRGDGAIAAANADTVIVQECEPAEFSCVTVLRDRSTWQERARLPAAPWSSANVYLAPVGPVGVMVDWRTGEAKVLDAASGELVDVTSDTTTSLDVAGVPGNSEIALLVTYDEGRLVLVDRADGRAIRVPGLSGVLVPAELPLKERSRG